jgi:hypothetical protein
MQSLLNCFKTSTTWCSCTISSFIDFHLSYLRGLTGLGIRSLDERTFIGLSKLQYLWGEFDSTSLWFLRDLGTWIRILNSAMFQVISLLILQMWKTCKQFHRKLIILIQVFLSSLSVNQLSAVDRKWFQNMSSLQSMWAFVFWDTATHRTKQIFDS